MPPRSPEYVFTSRKPIARFIRYRSETTSDVSFRKLKLQFAVPTAVWLRFSTVRQTVTSHVDIETQSAL